MREGRPAATCRRPFRTRRQTRPRTRNAARRRLRRQPRTVSRSPSATTASDARLRQRSATTWACRPRSRQLRPGTAVARVRPAVPSAFVARRTRERSASRNWRPQTDGTRPQRSASPPRTEWPSGHEDHLQEVYTSMYSTE